MYVYRKDYQPWIGLFPLENSHNKSSVEQDEVTGSLSTFLVVSSARLGFLQPDITCQQSIYCGYDVMNYHPTSQHFWNIIAKAYADTEGGS